MLSAQSPFSFILFGGSGHLATIKIYPALYTLASKKRLPAKYNVVGFARSEMDESAFRKLVEESIRAVKEKPDEKILQDFLKHIFYVQGQYDEKKDFEKMEQRLQELEADWKEKVRVAYLSVPPTVFGTIAQNLRAGGVYKSDVQFRCIVEKPVGNDLVSYEALKQQLMASFAEDEIYLLDHYLGKEAVRNIYFLRFANPVLERIFKNTLIHHVEVTASEFRGLEGRAGYFEHVGMFRDMFQSHLLMILSLLTMRLQENDESFQQSRFNALEQIYLPPASDLGEIVLQGQYGAGKINEKKVIGYQQEQGVADDSRTNTFVALKLHSRMSRWEGVPFFLRSGKRLAKKETRISILFQEPHPVGHGGTRNRLDIILQGEAGMRLHLQTKISGVDPSFRPLIMEDPLVCMGDCLPEHGILLLEAIHGKKQWYMTFPEVQAAWRLLDPVQAYLDKKNTPLHMYDAGTDGPPTMHTWIEKEGTEWLN